MDVDSAPLEAVLLDQFSDRRDKLAVASCPVLCDLVTARVLPEIDNDGIRRLVGAAIDLAIRPEPGRPAVDLATVAKLAGARAYFYLDSGPTDSELTQIRQVHRPRTVTQESQACRFSWAKWQHDRALNPANTTAPNERSGRNQRHEYAAALAEALREALRRPTELRAAMNAAMDQGAEAARWSPEVRELLAVSTTYSGDMRVSHDLYVPRTIEPELLSQIGDVTRPWPRKIVGEAGSGKSTLLWSLGQALATRPTVLALLLPTTWLLQHTGTEPAEAIVESFKEIEQADRQPVLLLDTVDLMLHEDASRQSLLRLVDALHAGGFPGIYSTRPQEAALLTHDQLRRHDLQLYDDIELDRAVEALARQHCPHVPPADVVARIRNATARELPVTGVCRSPLLLRMLFELSVTNEPELRDVDVTSLLEAYWERRIKRDARSEAAVALRTRPTENLSTLSGHVGVALLASGIPELRIDTLQEVTQTAEPSRTPELIDEGLSVLLERGALVRHGSSVGYFHQIMFEFAAAKGVLAASEPTRIDMLATRTTSHGGDLFVGAVLEQTLILAGTNPLLRQAAQRAVKALIAADSEAVRAIGLVAWAHHPEFVSDTSASLRAAGSPALERAARILPTIAAKTTGQTISQLMLIWQATDQPHVRSVVLDALARLGLRAPADVADALTYLNPLQAIRGSTDNEPVRRSLLGILRVIASHARADVRAMLVAMLIDAESRPLIELAYLADQWHDIGDEHLLAEVTRVLETDAKSVHTVAAGLGRIMAAEWHRAGTWDNPADWQDFLSHATDAGAAATPLEFEATLCAIGQFLVTINDDERIAPAIDALLDTSHPQVRDITSQIVLRDIIWSESQSAVTLEAAAKAALATIGYAAQKHRIDGRQQLLMDLLAQSQLPDGLLARLLPVRLESKDWVADSQLLRIAPAAADHGARAAIRFITRVATNPTMLSTEQLDVLFSTQAMHMPKSETVYDAVVAIAARTSRVSDLNKVVTSSQRSPHLARHVPHLLTRARELLAGDDHAKRDAWSLLAALMAATAVELPWEELGPILDSIEDPQLLNPLIQNLWQHTPAGEVTEQLSYLERFIEVHPDAGRPVIRKHNDPTVELSTAVVCVAAMLRILCLRAEPLPERWPIIRTLGLYELEREDVFVVGPTFAVMCEYFVRCRVSQLGEFLIDYLRRLAMGEFFGINSALWHHALQNAVLLACAPGIDPIIQSLIETCASLDESLSEVITATIAERYYTQTRDYLRGLSQADVSPSLRVFLLEPDKIPPLTRI